MIETHPGFMCIFLWVVIASFLCCKDFLNKQRTHAGHVLDKLHIVFWNLTKRLTYLLLHYLELVVFLHVILFKTNIYLNFIWICRIHESYILEFSGSYTSCWSRILTPAPAFMQLSSFSDNSSFQLFNTGQFIKVYLVQS